MILRSYSIYDVKALQYHSPWFAVSDGSAVRSFSDMANDQNTTIGRHPRDYTLYLVGTYDDNSGLFSPIHPPVHVMDAAACVQQQADLPLAPQPLSPAQSAEALRAALNGKENV